MTVKETKPAAAEKHPTKFDDTCGVQPVNGAGPVITAVSERTKETVVQGIVRSLTEVARDVRTIMAAYDKNGDGKLDASELTALKLEYKTRRATLSPEVRESLEHYDQNHDGEIDDTEEQQLLEDIKTTDTMGRYAGYSPLVTRLFRYLAFTSDVGEAFRPVVAPRLVTLSYAVSWTYCGVDVAYETYKQRQKGADTQALLNMAVERSVFQSFASMALPAAAIHTQVRVFRHVFNRVGRFQRWGPTLMGLSLIPFLPYMFDHPVEHATAHAFKHYWPWRKGHHINTRVTLQRTPTTVSTNDKTKPQPGGDKPHAD